MPSLSYFKFMKFCSITSRTKTRNTNHFGDYKWENVSLVKVLSSSYVSININAFTLFVPITLFFKRADTIKIPIESYQFDNKRFLPYEYYSY